MRNNVLVIDDDLGILDALKITLQTEGYEVSTSLNADILKSFNSALPDVILLDYLLSGENGCQIVRRLKSKSITRNIPIIMMSAHPSAKSNIMKCGAKEFLSKPFDIKKLLKTIHCCIEG